MATITKSFTENQVSDMPKATWTVSLSGADYSVTETGQTISVSAISCTAKYVGSSKGKCSIDLTGATRVTGNNGSYYGGSVSKYRGSYDSPYTVASGTTFSLLNSSGGNFNVNASNLFTSSNPTEKTKAITFVSATVDVGTYNSNYSVANGYYGSISFSPSTLGTITYKCPPVLATCSLSKNTSDYFAGLTRVTFNVPITYSASGTTGTAKYGGYIKKIEVAIGSQTKTVTFDESTKPTSAQTLFIDLSSAGTFTPTITVTDSRDQIATQTLSDITVLPYNVPSTTFDVYRTNNIGIKNDEGHYALIQSTISYTDGAATLTEPSIQIDGADLSSLTDASVTWYKTWNNTSGVSNVISDWTTLVPQNHMVTIYGLIDWDYDTTGNFAEDTSYQITLVANDSLNGHSTPITQTMSTAFYTIDFQAGGKEIAFGAPANDDLTDVNGNDYSNEGLFKCRMHTWFEQDVNTNGDVICMNIVASNLIGEIKQYAGTTVPIGWLECDGSEVAIADYPLLYAAIGNLWGTPSDSDHFILPNFKGKVPVGYDSSQTEFDTVGESGGAKTHTLTTAQIPAHTHGARLTNGSVRLYKGSQTTTASGSISFSSKTDRQYAQSGTSTNSWQTATFSLNHTHDSVGGSGAHNNLQPYAVVKYIICAV